MANETIKAETADGAATGKTHKGVAVKGTPEYDLIVEHDKRLALAADIRREGCDKLAEAELEFPPLLKDKTNPHFRNKYASEEAIYKAVKPALLKRGIVLIHSSFITGDMVFLKTQLVYRGEVLKEGVRPIGPVNQPIQAAGGTSTYNKRYNSGDLLALAAEDDDDGEAATRSAAKADTPF